MSEEQQTSVSDQVGERMASESCSDFHIRHMAGILPVSSGSFVVPTCQMYQCESTEALWCLAPIQQDKDYVSLVEAYLGIQPDA